MRGILTFSTFSFFLPPFIVNVVVFFVVEAGGCPSLQILLAPRSTFHTERVPLLRTTNSSPARFLLLRCEAQTYLSIPTTTTTTFTAAIYPVFFYRIRTYVIYASVIFYVKSVVLPCSNNNPNPIITRPPSRNGHSRDQTLHTCVRYEMTGV